MAVNAKRQKEMKALGILLQNDKEHFAINKEDIIPMVDKIIDYYKEVGIKGERISGVMDRIGK